MSDRITAAEYNEYLRTGKLPHQAAEKKRPKYNNQRTEYNGKVYPSRLEANYAAHLNIRLRAKDIVKYFEQVPFEIEGGKYYADFVILHLDGTYEVVDTKGVRTDKYMRTKRQIKERYGIDITEVTKV